MTFDRDDAKIGLLVLLSLGVFIALLFHRSMTRLVKTETPYTVRLHSASDIAVGTEVYLQGVRVGQVNSVDLDQEGVEYRVRARIGVNPKIALWGGTKVLVASKGFGGAFLDLQLGPVAQRKVALQPGAVLEGEVAPSIAGVVEEIQGLARNLNTSVDLLRGHLEKKGLGALLDHPSVRKVLVDLDETLRSANTLAKDGQGLVKKADPATESLARSLASLEKTLAMVEARNGDLDSTISGLARTMKELEGLTTEMRGQLKSTGPEADAALQALNRNLQTTEELLLLLKAKPSRVLWGTPGAKELEAARKKAENARKIQKH